MDNDHLGHGKSVQSQEGISDIFMKKKGMQYVISDIHRLRKMTEKEYPGVPYFMMGHSMGSFLLRQYLTMRAEGLAGAIVMGTGDMPYALLKAGPGGTLQEHLTDEGLASQKPSGESAWNGRL